MILATGIYLNSSSVNDLVYNRNFQGHVCIPFQIRDHVRHNHSHNTDNFGPHGHMVRHIVYEDKICHSPSRPGMFLVSLQHNQDINLYKTEYIVKVECNF